MQSLALYITAMNNGNLKMLPYTWSYFVVSCFHRADFINFQIEMGNEEPMYTVNLKKIPKSKQYSKRPAPVPLLGKILLIVLHCMHYATNIY